ncbi:hypothetical protein DPMN_025778 [Dreissena polymorpha]|uniref:Cadherin domain-containing protein n=1 Tax=Dreissena polymorpha TaxID=45954 RepID=A0A9D4LS50_DREPO|nr:hypothetical protein DPMN_025778 [Dreissena polymorpha]
MDPPNSDFSVNPTTGVISSLRQLNYEAQSTYTFFVTTTQGSSSPVPNRRAQVTIEVIVSSLFVFIPNAMI